MVISMQQLSLFSDPVMPRIRDRLMPHYGSIEDEVRYGPTEQFVVALIGSRTRDEISKAAFARLRAHFPRWEMLLTAEAATVTALIFDVQDASVKAARLIEALRRLQARHNTLDLSFLADWPVDIAWSWLQTLPGAGPKVAAATLNFSTLRKPILAVDRHVLRNAKRLGLLPPKADFMRGHRVLNGLIPNGWTERDRYQQHWLMKSHGQTICRHGIPQCGDCPLKDICRHFFVHHDGLATTR